MRLQQQRYGRLFAAGHDLLISIDPGVGVPRQRGRFQLRHRGRGLARQVLPVRAAPAAARVKAASSSAVKIILYAVFIKSCTVLSEEPPEITPDPGEQTFPLHLVHGARGRVLP